MLVNTSYVMKTVVKVCASSSPCVGEHILGEDSGLGLC